MVRLIRFDTQEQALPQENSASKTCSGEMVLFQFSKIIIFIFLVALLYFAVKIFFALPFKKLRPLTDVILVFIIFSFLLAFTVNF